MAASSCGGIGERRHSATEVVFAEEFVDLAVSRRTSVQLRNTGTRAMGPIELSARGTWDSTGAPIAALLPSVSVSPTDIATLNPGSARSVDFVVRTPGETAEGLYTTRLHAQLIDGSVLASFDVRFRVGPAPHNKTVTSVSIVSGPRTVRQGDVLQYAATALDSAGSTVEHARVTWTVSPHTAGHATADGRFVGYEAGAARLVARAGAASDTVQVTIAARKLPRMDRTPARRVSP
jgi:hypothetical protein